MTPAASKRPTGTRVDGETRGRLVSAAFRVLVRDGYDATSIKDIAREADVAPGLVHYYFENKQELVHAVIEAGCERYFQMRSDAGFDMLPSEEARLRLDVLKGSMRRFRGFWMLVFDMNARALHDPHVRSTIRSFLDRDRADIERIVRAVAAEAELGPALPPVALAGAIYGAINGMILQKLIDPKFDFDAAVDALEAMALSLLGKAK